MDKLSRRAFLRSGLLAAVAPAGAGLLGGCDFALMDRSRLGKADDNGVRLPRGFSSRVVARSGEAPLRGGDFTWHAAPDGGACLPYSAADGWGWIYISNSEIDDSGGGASCLRFNVDGKVVDAYPILAGTSMNCAGGLTPWDTWLSCEEIEAGLVWECDPYGLLAAEPRPAMGVFKHEAVAVDRVNRQLYMTEDNPDGGLYRFTPDKYPDLSSGTLEVATGRGVTEHGISLGWAEIDDPLAVSRPTRYQHPDMYPFNGGEGMIYREGFIYYTTKGDDSIWQLDITESTVVRFYDDDDYADPVLTGVDNMTADAAGRLFVAEDGGDMQVVMLNLDGRILPILQVDGHEQSEITGIAFSPDGTRLYFSSQRGATGKPTDGVTYEVRGPFIEL